MLFGDKSKENNNPFVEETKDKEELEQEQKQEETSVETEETEENEVSKEEEKLKAEIEDINNKYLRLAADFDNYRKRQMQERESLLKYGAEDTLKKIIPVLDTFERAKASIEKSEEIEAVKSSYDVCIKQLNDILDKIGLKKIEAKGQIFDPNLHEAVMQTPTDEYPQNTIINELQTGYKLHDRILRPTLVNVATEKEDNGEE